MENLAYTPRGWLLGLLLSLILPFGRLEAEDREVTVNRNDLSIRVGDRLLTGDLRLREGQVGFKFIAPEGDPNPAQRFSFKLEGCDSDWREYVTGRDSVMRVGVIFYDRSGNWLAPRDFGVAGNSPGWTGTPEESPLRRRSEVFPVPSGATTMSVVISSAGPPQEIGTLAVGALTLSKMADKGGAALLRMEFPPGGDNVPTGWSRTGSRPSITRIITSRMAPAGHLLGVVDEDVSAHGEWQSHRIPVDLAQGELLRMEWLECFSAGNAGNLYFSYHNIAPGRHLFRFKKLTAHGVPTGQEGEFPLIIVLPFWKQTWFTVMSGIVAAALSIGLARYWVWRQTRLEIAELRQKNAIQAERVRIARDLHDTLEQGLTGLTMQLRCAAEALDDDPADARESVASARQLVKQCHSELRQSIWNLRSAEIEPIDLGEALKRMAESLAAGLKIQIDLRQETSGVRLPMQVENNLLRIAQESITNAIKNAGASRITITLSATHSEVRLQVNDNGRGFTGDIDSLCKNGHFGLQGMRERTQSIGGHLSISSGNDAGCAVCVVVPLQGVSNIHET